MGRLDERVAIVTGAGRGIGRLLTDLVAQSGRDADPLVRQRLATLWIRRSLLNYTNQRSRTATPRPGAVGPISKLSVSDLTRGQRDLGLAVQGPAGVVVGEQARSSAFQYFALNSPSLSIAGGTDEIQRNIIGERGLGLPKDISVDREIPFRDVPRSST